MGLILIITGIFLLLIGLFSNSKNVRVEYGVGGFIGPIPFGFANTKTMLYFTIALSIFFFLLFLLLRHTL
ncbi:MAG TPA: DUF131 domain-containing protein [Candidatus Aenigmarchaeota archaeon]|nr:DUF131 domain-containing protein [Candidatus Aenigmarchaeota archaeon]